jgi:hypothetical protein
MARNLEETSHVRVRIDPIRLAKLQKQADKNSRTLTGEIIHRLDESFRRGEVMDAAVIERLSDRIAAKVVAALKRGGDEK